MTHAMDEGDKQIQLTRQATYKADVERVLRQGKYDAYILKRNKVFTIGERLGNLTVLNVQFLGLNDKTTAVKYTTKNRLFYVGYPNDGTKSFMISPDLFVDEMRWFESNQSAWGNYTADKFEEKDEFDEFMEFDDFQQTTNEKKRGWPW